MSVSKRLARVARINRKRPPYRVEVVITDRQKKDVERNLVKREIELLDAYTSRKTTLRELDKGLHAIKRERKSLGKLQVVSWATLRKMIIRRDGGRCGKCADGSALHVHHKIERCDGGTDDPMNLVTLCASCHMEWTHCPPNGDVPFDNWLLIPPARMVTGLLATPGVWTQTMDAATMRSVLQAAFDGVIAKRTRGAA